MEPNTNGPLHKILGAAKSFLMSVDSPHPSVIKTAGDEVVTERFEPKPAVMERPVQPTTSR